MILLPFHLWFREAAGELSAGWGAAALTAALGSCAATPPETRAT